MESRAERAEGAEAALHRPVMVEEALEALRPERGGVYLDATVGLGGHARAILQRLPKDGVLIGMDRDGQALAETERNLADPRLRLRHGRFSEMRPVMEELGIAHEGLDGVLFDFGVSMMQLRLPGRGFSFLGDEPLDMRMDPSQDEKTAMDVINDYDETELARVIFEYGEERASRRVARAIVRERGRGGIRTCRALADVVARALGGVRGRIHPATRTFQALRIEVNDELQEISAGLAAAGSLLRCRGRLAAISYHSLEDRIVKRYCREAAARGAANVLTKKPLRPGAEEGRSNPASRSARLRALEAVC